MPTEKNPLSAIQEYAQSYAEVISRITGIDVEIMDNRAMRIAGTGIYAEGVGKSLLRAGELYKEVLRSHKTVVVENPRNHPLCRRCAEREKCRELFSLSTPIVEGGTVYGVIGLVCFSEEDRIRMIGALDSYGTFITFLAEALAHKASDHVRLNRATRFLELMFQVVDIPGQGMMLFDYNGRLIYANTAAKELFALLPDARSDIGIIARTGTSLYEFDEFEVRPPTGEAHQVFGRLVELDSQSQGKVTLFVFEMPNRLGRLVGDLSTPVTDTGFGSIVGSSPAIMKLKDKAMKVADSSSTILITGESGTGKELLARAIHRAGGRRDQPFIAINCGGIPDTLLESELFGYVSGAFTGASSRGRMGKFELAQNGVIFLDEISSMPLYLQVKLLRVLQEKVIIRLGSNRLVHVNVRVIAAANEDLLGCIRRNTFREDLYYRLNVIPLYMPALSERKGDVPILADFFVEKYCGLFNKSRPRLRSSLLRLLEAYPWPGNVRELEHVLEYAVNMMPDKGPLGIDCLPTQLLAATRAETAAPAATAVSPSSPSSAPADFPLERLSVLEDRAVRAALTRFGTSTEGKKLAAAALGISLATLYRKLPVFSS